MVSRGELLHRVPEKVAAGRAALLQRGWLARTPPAFQEELLRLAVWRTAEAGTQFIHMGETKGGLVGIAQGVAEVSVGIGHPDTPFIHLVHSGFWAGTRPLLGKARNISVKARTDVLWALIPQIAMEKLLAEQPERWRQIALMIDMGYETSLQILLDLTRKHGLPRVAATLLRLAGCRAVDPVHPEELEIHVPQAEIAALAVMSRNTLSTYIAELAGRNLIDAGYRTVRILDVAGLRAILEAEE